ncbi:Uncharacterised protein [uncultured archaeon]|nr:Uncharacterised protein [uncultured archaeon]
MKTFHVGVDQAFRHSGYAILSWDAETKKTEFVDSGVFNSTLKMGSASDALTFLEHMSFIKTLVSKVKKLGETPTIAIEGVAIGAVGQATARGGIFAVYTLHATKNADLVVVSPKKLKSYWTDDGSAEKEDMAAIILPKYSLVESMAKKYEGKNAEDRKRMWDEVDAIGIAEVGLNAWRVLTHGIDSVKGELTPNQQRILWSEEVVKKKNKSAAPKLFGICNRLDDFYIKKRA